MIKIGHKEVDYQDGVVPICKQYVKSDTTLIKSRLSNQETIEWRQNVVGNYRNTPESVN